MAELVSKRVRGPVRWRRLPAAIGISTAAAVLAAAVLYAAGMAAGIIDRRVMLPSLIGMGPLSLASVSVTAVAAGAAAGAVFAAVLATTARAVAIFRVAVSLPALASLAMPATIPGPPAGMRLLMGAMHVVVWAAAVGLLPALGSRGLEGR